MNNKDFLEAVFGPDTSPIVCSFAGDPSSPPPGSWNPTEFHRLRPESNTYFCVSTFKGGRRIKKNFLALYALVVDDVGTKVSIEEVESHLGPPTWTNETSSGNFQWGYLLNEPLADRARAERLIRVAIEMLGDGEDPGMAGVTRYVRLPDGRNWKPKHNGWRHRFEWRGGAFTVEHLEQALHITGDTPLDKAHVTEAVDQSADPIAKLLLERDLVKEIRDGGRYVIKCPWYENHTDAIDDDGTAYLSPDGFRCHHGHCVNKTFRDFETWLQAEVPSTDRLAANKITNPDVWDFKLNPPGERFEAPPRIEAGSLVELGSIRDFADDNYKLIQPPPRQWIIDKILARGVTAILAGRGGVGKGRLTINMAMAMATGRSWGPILSIGKPLRVLYLGKEDDREEMRRRVYYSGRSWEDLGLHLDVKTLTRNLIIPPPRMDIMLDVDSINGVIGGLGEWVPDVVVVDPLMRYVPNDVSLNSQEGAGWVHNGLGRFHEAYPGCAVIAVHHVNKPGVEKEIASVTDITGSQGLSDLGRASIQMTRLGKNTKERLGFLPSQTIVAVSLTKSNYSKETESGQEWLFEMVEEGVLIPTDRKISVSSNAKELVGLVAENGGTMTVADAKRTMMQIMTKNDYDAAVAEAKACMGLEQKRAGSNAYIFTLPTLDF